MAFRLNPDRPVSSEIHRIVLRQLDAATAELTSVGDPESDEAVHDARRRVKKVRAVIRLMHPGLRKALRVVDRDLHDVNRLLAPIADGQGIIATFDALALRYHKRLPARVVASIRRGLVERGSQMDRRARSDRVLQTAVTILRGEWRRIDQWPPGKKGFRALASGLKRSFRRSRSAMRTTWRSPTVAHYHGWRRLVKNHWFHVRLLESRCGNQLGGDERRLEALDGVLGEYHNLNLLCDVLVHQRYISRAGTDRCLQAVSGYQRVLQQQAQRIGTAVYREKPRRFVQRVKHLWRPSPSNHRGRHAAQ
jgi:CHAD domain-containing protein